MALNAATIFAPTDTLKKLHADVKAEIKRREGGLPGWVLPVALGGGALVLWMMLKGKK